MLTIFAAACIDLQKRVKIDSCICKTHLIKILPKWQLKVLATNVNVVGQSELAEGTPFFVK